MLHDYSEDDQSNSHEDNLTSDAGTVQQKWAYHFFKSSPGLIGIN
jgi:hypothetical protein